MKKISTWGIIIGLLFVIPSISTLTTRLANPTNLPMVNVAVMANNVTLLAIGVFLIIVSLRKKHLEQQQIDDPNKVALDSDEDKKRLQIKNQWVLGFVILFGAISSLEGWILNDYSAGLTLLNIFAIFDLVFNVVFIYIAINFFRGNSNLTKLLTYSVLIYGVGSIIIEFLRSQYLYCIVIVFMSVYFVYASSMKITRRNFKIANYVLLPLFFAGIIAVGPFSEKKMDDLMKTQSLLEQQFSDGSAKIDNLYTLYLQKDSASTYEIANLINAVNDRNSKISEISTNLEKIKLEYEKELPSIKQKETYEKIKYINDLMDLHIKQGQKIVQLMEFIEKHNDLALSEKDKGEINQLKNEIFDINDMFTEKNFEFSKKNLRDL